MNTQPTDALYDAACTLASDRVAAEFDLVGAILADPTKGVAVGSEIGMRVELIDEEDLRVIMNALRVKVMLKRLTGDRHADQLSVAILARAGLQKYGFWDDSQIAGNLGSSRWSDASLAALFGSWFHSPRIILQFVQKLRDIDTRQREAADAYARCREILEGPQAAVATAALQQIERRRGAA